MVGGEDNIEKVMQENELTTVVLTLGSEGAKVFFKGEVFSIPGKKVKSSRCNRSRRCFLGRFSFKPADPGS